MEKDPGGVNTDLDGAKSDRDKATHKFIIALVILFVARGLLLSSLTPLWQAPDEMAHFANVQTIAERGDFLNMRSAKLSQEVSRSLNRWTFWSVRMGGRMEIDKKPAAGDLSERRTDSKGSNWISQHPPLYYLILASGYLLAYGGSLLTRVFLVRLISIPMGAAVVYISWLLARKLFPGDRFMELTLPIFVAFLPMFSYINSVINNDNLVDVISAMCLLLLATELIDGWKLGHAALGGILLGMALLTKLTALFLAPLFGLALVIPAMRDRGKWLTQLKMGAALFCTAGALSFPWFLRSRLMYGAWLSKYSTVQTPKAPTGAFGTIVDFIIRGKVLTALNSSFWGSFGWLDFHLPSYARLTVWLLVRLAGLGLIILVGRVVWKRSVDFGPRRQALAVVLSGVVFQPMLVIYNAYEESVRVGAVRAVQGRYLFPILLPLGIVFLVGLRSLVPENYRAVATKAFFGLALAGELVFMSVTYIPRYYI